MRIFSFLLVGIMLFIMVDPVFCMKKMPYQPAEDIELFTESTSLSDKDLQQGSSNVEWRVRTEICEHREPCVVFYHHGSPDPVCRLVLSGEDAGLIFSDETRYAGGTTADGLMLFPGFSIPCDVLPLPENRTEIESKVFEGRRHAGTTTFIERFRVDNLNVSLEKAMAQGWIREPAQLPETFILIRVTNLRTGELAAQQLWILGDTWWLYEETPYRRSWRLR